MALKQRLYRSIMVSACALALITLATFRSVGVGSDDAAYELMFIQIPSFFDCDTFLCNYSYSQFNIEVGFFTLLSLLSSISTSHYLLFGFISSVAILYNIRSIKYFTPHVGAATLVYFSHFYLNKELNAIRLGLASAILFWAATYAGRKRYLAMWVLVVGAICIHVSSVLFIVPFLLYSRISNRAVYAVGGLALLVFAALIDLKLLFSYATNFGFIGEKIELYLNADMYSYALPLLSVVNLKNIFIVILSLIWWKKLSEKYEHFELIFCFFYCATFLRIVLGDFAIFAGRSYAAISMFEYVLLPAVAFVIFGRWVGYLMIGIYSLLTLYLNLTTNSGWAGEAEVFFDFFNL
ncbi:EpsG family protein [Pseudomonas sp. RTC3]|uniref:EpsG family protein n=1 Tax=unclassified Pseudomonas TaxID=196821 RepID=UPI002AB38783|nr:MULTISPECIES: EpsG family protein [unclassified Pseudomonas]MEB0064158.1 EpsG family protein [Pseudomonas sp. RTC3]MDY7565985.1 EpsG family protein [Pseudomonas sp. 5C2]MEB0007616.1 EpsG family protein [Pseudomonas sp. RTB2]MEB0239329.1 EpsG family protein [Pseudomonas sp. 5C2]MEB0270751.1 EpsG family protein [Pseudomonas sp. 5B4]